MIRGVLIGMTSNFLHEVIRDVGFQGLTGKTLCLDMRLYLCRKNDGKGRISIRVFALCTSNGDS